MQKRLVAAGSEKKVVITAYPKQSSREKNGLVKHGFIGSFEVRWVQMGSGGCLCHCVATAPSRWLPTQPRGASSETSRLQNPCAKGKCIWSFYDVLQVRCILNISMGPFDITSKKLGCCYQQTKKHGRGQQSIDSISFNTNTFASSDVQQTANDLRVPRVPAVAWRKWCCGMAVGVSTWLARCRTVIWSHPGDTFCAATFGPLPVTSPLMSQVGPKSGTFHDSFLTSLFYWSWIRDEYRDKYRDYYSFLFFLQRLPVVSQGLQRFLRGARLQGHFRLRLVCRRRCLLGKDMRNLRN